MKEQTTTAAVLMLENIEQKQARREAAARARHPEIQLELFSRVTKWSNGKMTEYAYQPDFAHISGIQYLLCGDDAARITLKRMSANTGTTLYTDLLNQSGLDRQNRNRAQLQQEHDEAEAAAEYHEAAAEAARKDKKYWKKIVNSIARSDEERAAAATLYAVAVADEAEHTRAAEKARNIAKAKQQALNDAAGSGYYEDLTQEAALSAIINQQAGNDIKTTRTAASRAIRQLSHPDALNTCRTDAQLLTKAEAADLMSRYAVDLTEKPPKHYESRTKGNKNSYITIEVRTGNAEYKKLVSEAAEGDNAAKAKLDSLAHATDPDTGKVGIICKVTHRYTIAPYMTVDFWNEGGIVEDTKNNGINAIFAQSDTEAITELFNRANLTDRERLIVARAADSTAAAHAKAARAAKKAEYAAKVEAQRQKVEAAEADTIAARRAYHDNPTDSTAEALKTAEQAEKQLKTYISKHAAEDAKAAQKAEDKAAAAAKWSSAFERTNITSERTQDNIKSKIKTALFAALNHPEQGPITLEEHQERETRKYARLMKDSRRGCKPQEKRISLLYWTEYEKPTHAAPVIDWTPTPESTLVTAAELEAAEEAARAARTAEFNAHGEEIAAIEYRRIITAHITPADWKQTRAEQYTKTHTAAAAALVIFDNLTARERAEAARAYQREQARAEAETRRAAERRPGYRAEVYKLAPDWSLWQTFTEEEKAEHNRYFEAIRTR